MFEAVIDDLRALLQLAQGRALDPSTVVCDSRILRSTTESGACAGYDDAKRKKGKAQAAALAQRVQAVTDVGVELAWAG